MHRCLIDHAIAHVLPRDFDSVQIKIQYLKNNFVTIFFSKKTKKNRTRILLI